MKKKFNLLLCFLSVIGLFSVLTAFTFLGSTHAALPSPSVPASAYVHKQITTEQLPAALCRQLKAFLPQKASDPNICTAFHVELSTDFIPTRPSTAANLLGSNACASGTKSFTENYWDWAQTFSVALNTRWSWKGDCKIPALTYEDCHINWTNFVTVTQLGCSSYTTTVPSRAALWVGWLQNGPFGSRIWARRECYVPVNDCNWTTT